jgi:hypothetical protein
MSWRPTTKSRGARTDQPAPLIGDAHFCIFPTSSPARWMHLLYFADPELDDLVVREPPVLDPSEPSSCSACAAAEPEL